MAIWQFDIWLVPRGEVLKHTTVIPDYMDLDWFESIVWWDDVSREELIEFFNGLLAEYATPWAKDTRSWGSNDGDRIELETSDGRIQAGKITTSDCCHSGI